MNERSKEFNRMRRIGNEGKASNTTTEAMKHSVATE